MNISETLAELAEEHLQRMAEVSWAGFASSIRAGRAGETFGCEVDGRYYDVGDQVAWVDQPGGDILLTTHATAANRDSSVGSARVERRIVIARS